MLVLDLDGLYANLESVKYIGTLAWKVSSSLSTVQTLG